MKRALLVAALAVLLALAGLVAGCASLQPSPLSEERLRYNELVKVTTEQQLLLNIVRLRYGDTPSSLAISGIATQTELVRSLGLLPFIGVTGNEAQVQTIARVLPTAQVSVADRPTVSLTPLDDAEFTRKLFTPMTMEGVLYLAKTTWPISTVFRLWLENLNWVSNAETASGPLARRRPDFARFQSGIEALQALQDRGAVVFTAEEREDRLGGALPAALIRPQHLVAAAKEGMEYRPDEGGASWSLIRRRPQAMMRIDPSMVDSPEMRAFTEAFRLQRDATALEIDIGKVEPFPDRAGARPMDRIDLETRSLLQVMYFMAKGVQVPAVHLGSGEATQALDEDGSAFDWRRVLGGLFHVSSSSAKAPPPGAHVAVRFRDHWFWLDRRDAESLSTFSLVLEMSRLELGGRPAGAAGPVLTLPLGGR